MARINFLVPVPRHRLIACCNQCAAAHPSQANISVVRGVSGVSDKVTSISKLPCRQLLAAMLWPPACARRSKERRTYLAATNSNQG